MQADFTPPPSRQIIDHGNLYTRWHIERLQNNPATPDQIRPEPSYLLPVPPPAVYRSDPITAMCSKFVHMSVNKTRQPVLCLAWTPDGRRVLTGAMSGEFTLWNGMNFNFEMLMQAHENEVRSMAYSHSGEWLLSGDRDGTLKVWQPNFNNVNIVNAHRETVSGIAWSPNDAKFATCSDDGLVKVWSFATMTQEAALEGHGWDVKSVDWHGSLGLLASGSKDNLVKLWDPRQAKSLATLHGFKNTITKTLFQKIGGQRLLASSSRDNTVRIFDLRMMRNVLVLRGHEQDVTALSWHPVHPELVTTGTRDGTINHFLLDTPLADNTTGILPTVTIPKAHGWPIWDLAYHPSGHILCSGSNDKSVRFWCRGRPGDPEGFKDRFFVGEGAEDWQAAELEKYRAREKERARNASKTTTIPGLTLVSRPVEPAAEPVAEADGNDEAGDEAADAAGDGVPEADLIE